MRSSTCALAVSALLAVSCAGPEARDGDLRAERDGSFDYTVGISGEPELWSDFDLFFGGTVWDFYAIPGQRTLYRHAFPGDAYVADLAAEEEPPDPVRNRGRYTTTVSLVEATWSDGTPVTAHDVAFTASLVGVAAEALDDRTVRFDWGRDEPSLLDDVFGLYTVPVVNEAFRTGQSAGVVDACDPEPISGPYTWDDTPATCGNLPRHQRPNPGFDLDLGAPDHAVITAAADEAEALDLMASGEIDFYAGPLGIRPSTAAEAAALGLQVTANDTNGWRFMGFNVRQHPWSDPEALWAFKCLLDPTGIVGRIVGTSPEDLTGFVEEQRGVMIESSPYNNPELHVICDGLTADQRVVTAYQTLQAKGWTWTTPPVDATGAVVPGAGLADPAGNPLAVEILNVPADYDPWRIAAGDYAAERWSAFGAAATNTPMPDFGVLVDRLFTGDFDVGIIGFSLGNPLYPDFLDVFFSADDPIGFNFTGYSDPGYEALLDDFRTERDLDALVPLVQEMEQHLEDNGPFYMLFTTQLVEMHSPRVAYPQTEGVLGGLQFWRLTADVRLAD